MAEAGAADARRLRFERIVAPWRDDLYRYVLWLSRDPTLSEDIVQEVLLRAFRALDSLNDEHAVKTWLLTIARREHARVYERKAPETRDIDELSAAENALIATGDDTDVADVRNAILQLDGDYREPLVLQVIFGLTTEEIAALLDIKQGAVLTRLHRARRKLLEIVKPDLELVRER
jgi:RNA polymerase sigma-70 factor, ECF subfamily